MTLQPDCAGVSSRPLIRFARRSNSRRRFVVFQEVSVSSAARVAAIQLIARKSPLALEAGSVNVPELFGANVFGLEQMRQRLPK
ncbi:MAG: hypothetical protein KAI24_25670, partial [Planctomycetes bacterium]|nr:hypothetical protein [Planctomycetota bacterium]